LGASGATERNPGERVSINVPKSKWFYPYAALWRGTIALLSLIILAGILPAAARQSNTAAAQSKPAATAKAKRKTTAVRHKPKITSHAVRHHAVAHRRVASHRTARRTTRRRYARHRYYMPRFDVTAGDFTKFDDPVVRQAAIAALGRYYGSVVALDPNDGRILSVVNQKLAFSSGFEPCSTIKPVIALAALRQGLINRNTMIRVGRRYSINLTEALAHSNNAYFAELGRRLGFQTVERYAHLLGLGERAGWDLPEEHPGTFPSGPPPSWRGGVGKMTSFGEGIQITPLQLAAMMSTFANGGSLYYLQYPRTEEQVKNFAPRLKRRIEIGPYADDIREGMLGAVEFGTARESYTPDGELVYAKTGTCTDVTRGGHLGWFVSYASSDDSLKHHPKLVLVVLLRRYGPRVSGPHAAEIGGRIYRSLYMKNFFSADNSSADTSSADNQ
jgi:penicillin-binding protein 2